MKLDKSNRSYSLLRYYLVICTKNLEEIFLLENPIIYLKDLIYNYFDHTEKKTKRKNVKLISSEIFPSYIKIHFQATPNLNLTKFIGILKSTTSFKFFQKFSELRIGNGLWSNEYLLISPGQFVQSHLDFFLDLHKKKV